jgi:hypothetical protein
MTPLITINLQGRRHPTMRTNEIPYWEKYMLTLREAAEYFHIGEKKMRQIVDNNLDANFLLESGNRIMIKRKLFEEYLDRASVI